MFELIVGVCIKSLQHGVLVRVVGVVLHDPAADLLSRLHYQRGQVPVVGLVHLIPLPVRPGVVDHGDRGGLEGALRPVYERYPVL